MKIDRRRLVKGIFSLIPALGFSGMAGARTGAGIDLGTSFSAIIDTFVPADDSPGAIDLEIDSWLLAKVRAHPDYLARVTEAVTALNRSALVQKGRPFAELSLADRTRMLESILSRRDAGNTFIQLNNLRQKTMTRFYTSEAAFEMLDYHPPSQGGYPDYARSPL